MANLVGCPFPPSSHIPGTSADRQGCFPLGKPRAKALGYSVRPFHGHYAHSPIRSFAGAFFLQLVVVCSLLQGGIERFTSLFR